VKKHRIREIALASQTRFAVMAAVWLSLFAYAGRPLLAGAAAAGLAPALGWTLLFVAALLPALPMLLGTRSSIHWTGYATLALFSTLFVLVIVGDVFAARTRSRAGCCPRRCRQHMAFARSARDEFTILGASGVLSLRTRAGALSASAKGGGPDRRTSAELEGYRIVQWSDVHVGATIRRAFVQSLVERTNALNADAVVITGDFVDGPMDALRDEVEPVRELRPRDGVFYVTGNHEYYWAAGEWIPLLQSSASCF
jgi:hypothetical protein